VAFFENYMRGEGKKFEIVGTIDAKKSIAALEKELA
jgi:hypothetical protein